MSQPVLLSNATYDELSSRIVTTSRWLYVIVCLFNFFNILLAHTSNVNAHELNVTNATDITTVSYTRKSKSKKSKTQNHILLRPRTQPVR